MTNRQAAAAETRKRLVAAAKELICTKGLVNTSVEEITQSCGVSKGTFYTYFKRKEDVVLELSQGMFGEILSDAMAVPGSIRSKLTFYMIHFSDYIEKGSVKMAQDWIGNVAHPDLCQEGVNKLRLDSSALESLLSMGISAVRSRHPLLRGSWRITLPRCSTASCCAGCSATAATVSASARSTTAKRNWKHF